MAAAYVEPVGPQPSPRAAQTNHPQNPPAPRQPISTATLSYGPIGVTSFESILRTSLAGVNRVALRAPSCDDSLFSSLSLSLQRPGATSQVIRATICDTLADTINLLDVYDIAQAMNRSPSLRHGLSQQHSTDEKRQAYIQLMRLPSSPGGAPELSAFARAYSMDVCVHMSTANTFTHFTPTRTPSSITIHLGEFRGEYWGSQPARGSPTPSSPPTVTTRPPLHDEVRQSSMALTDSFSDFLRPLGLQVVEVPALGDCLFECLSLSLPSCRLSHDEMRETICDGMEANALLTPDIITLHASDNVTLSSALRLTLPPTTLLQTYVRHMRVQGTYGGHLEIQQFSDIFNARVTTVTRQGNHTIEPRNKHATAPATSVYLGLDRLHYWGSRPDGTVPQSSFLTTSPGRPFGAQGIG